MNKKSNVRQVITGSRPGLCEFLVSDQVVPFLQTHEVGSVGSWVLFVFFENGEHSSHGKIQGVALQSELAEATNLWR